MSRSLLTVVLTGATLLQALAPTASASSEPEDCWNRHDARFTHFRVDNGLETVDVTADPERVIRADPRYGYRVEYVANSRAKHGPPGAIWMWNNAYGIDMADCRGPVAPGGGVHHRYPVVRPKIAAGTTQRVQWRESPRSSGVTFRIEWVDQLLESDPGGKLSEQIAETRRCDELLALAERHGNRRGYLVVPWLDPNVSILASMRVDDCTRKRLRARVAEASPEPLTVRLFRAQRGEPLHVAPEGLGYPRFKEVVLLPITNPPPFLRSLNHERPVHLDARVRVDDRALTVLEWCAQPAAYQHPRNRERWPDPAPPGRLCSAVSPHPGSG